MQLLDRGHGLDLGYMAEKTKSDRVREGLCPERTARGQVETGGRKEHDRGWAHPTRRRGL